MDYKQKHPETCLAKCLIILLEQHKNHRIKKKYELDLLIFSLKYERENIARGHLEKIIKDFKVGVTWYVDSKIFFDFVKVMQIPKSLTLTNQKVDLKLINNLLIEKPLILYVDLFYLWKQERGLYYKYHYPHFIIVHRKRGDFYEIIDPEDGAVKRIEANIVSKAIRSLRNHLWISPQLIQIN